MSLQWPFTGTIRDFELLNWLEDKGHYKMTLSIDTNDDFVRITEGVLAPQNHSYCHVFMVHSKVRDHSQYTVSL